MSQYSSSLLDAAVNEFAKLPGIGRKTALRLVGKNFAVSNISRTPCRLDRVKNYTADVAAGDSLEKAVREAAAATENLYGLVYCAGCSMAAPIEYAEEKDYRYLFEVNYFGALRAMQSAVPHMKKRGGKIVLISSMAGLFPVAFDGFYSSSKAALDMLAKSADIELSPFNIRVTSVQPGGTSTSFTFKRKIYPEEDNREYSARVNRATAALANMEQSGMKPSRVAEDIYKTLMSDRPPIIKTCGAMNTAKRLATRMMPEKLTLYIDERMFHQ